MTGKDKCKMLKEIRRQIAEKNDIEWITNECQHKGECKGTCPKCESEVRALERALERRRTLGKAVMVVGVSTIVLTGMTGCSLIRGGGGLAGDIPYEGGIEEPIETPIELDGEIAIEPDLEGDVAPIDEPGLREVEPPINKEIETPPIGEIEPPTEEVER